MKNLKCLAFDLDDTLLDTSGLLLPKAARQACDTMLALGLKCSTEDCMQSRTELAKEMSHREIFLEIARKFGRNQDSRWNHQDLQPMARAGIESFYNPDIPNTLPLLPFALENLKVLAKNYTLFLVTSGAPLTQNKKVDAAGVRGFFKKVYTLDGFKGEKKRSAFADIISSEKINPWELLSIGNRLFEEIRQAKQLGGKTCYFKYGDHVGEAPQVPEDHADFTVLSHQELILTCQL